jgi:hypothetical protein
MRERGGNYGNCKHYMVGAIFFVIFEGRLINDAW